MSGIHQPKFDFTGLLAGAVGLATVGALLAGLNLGLGHVRGDATNSDASTTATTEPLSASVRMIPIDEMPASETSPRPSQTIQQRQSAANTGLSPASKADSKSTPPEPASGQAVAYDLPDLAVVPPAKPQRNVRSAVGTPQVTRFDTCLPACDTQDPLTASGQAKPVEVAVDRVAQIEPELVEVEPLSAGENALELLKRTVNLPMRVAASGRSMLEDVVRVVR